MGEVNILALSDRLWEFHLSPIRQLKLAIGNLDLTSKHSQLGIP
jgi:hypothetical protein